MIFDDCAMPQKWTFIAEKGDNSKSLSYKFDVRQVRFFRRIIWWSKSREESLARKSSVAPVN
ncbi:hypothetical protein V1291_000102 [Nitrobacteraceae bacterium AZCC 1564]